ncbi:MAG: hypothetical protein K8R90_06580 [Candidatus Cloacimonetes bacterium]|nr:hypothetical protein [Candidatus Cloacimonadota bacterium]
MKTGILCVLIMLTSTMSADVLFYDNFDRADGEVGNDWQFNTPPHLTNSAIVDSVFNISLIATGNASHAFDSLSSGKVYVEYDWKLDTNDWTACIYPVEDMIYLRCDWQGNIAYDETSNFTTPTPVTQINFGQWYELKICYDLDNDTFSFWLDGTQFVTDAPGNTVSFINAFYFLNLNATNFVQQIDDFIVYDDTPPDTPANLTATENIDSIVLDWDAVPEPMFVTYKVYRDITPNPTTEIAEVGPDSTTYVDMVRATQNTDYYYRVKAVGLDGQTSAYSNEVQLVHLLPDISVTGTPVNIDVGYGYTDSTCFTIHNNGNYDLEYSITGVDTTGVDTTGLVAYYPFDGNANDESGHGNNGTAYGATLTSDRFNNDNSAYFFDGVNDYLLVGQSNDFIFDTADFTIDSWFKATNIVNTDPVIFAGATDLCFMLQLSYNSDDPKLALSISNGISPWGVDGFYCEMGSTTILEDTWNHVVLVRSANTFKVYLNSVEDITRYQVIDIPDPYGFRIGIHANTNNPFLGSIDDIHVYNRALSETEIHYLYGVSHHTVSPSSGTIPANTSADIQVTIDASDLEPGVYNDTLFVYSNDPDEPLVNVSVSSTVHPPDIDITGIPVNIDVGYGYIDSTTFNIGNVGDGLLEYSITGMDTTGLVAYYPFDGNANDESGNEHIGSVNGAVLTTDRFENVNKAYEFFGTDEYISVQDNNDFDLFSSIDSKATISTWVKLNVVSGEHTILTHKTTGIDTRWVLGHYSAPGNGIFFAIINAGTISYQLHNLEELNDTDWHHLALVKDGSQYKIFIDGEISFTGTSTATVNANGNLWMGVKCDTWPGDLNGKLDEVKLYNRALSGIEVRALYNQRDFLSNMSVYPTSGILSSNENEDIQITIDATSMNLGTYTDTLKVFSNDPDEDSLSVIVNTTVHPPAISTDIAELEVRLNAGGNTHLDTFDIINSGIGKLEYEICGNDTLKDFGNSLEFDGNGDYVQISDDALWDFGPGDFTIELWANPSNIYNNDTYIEIGQVPNSILLRQENSTTLYIQIFGSPFSFPFIPSIGEWFHLTVTRASNQLKVLIGGEQIGNASCNHNIQISNVVRIGSSVHATGQYFNGNIDEVRIWNITRSQTEVQTNMHLELIGEEIGLVGYWKFNEGTGGTAYDSTPNGNNGILTNMNLTTCWSLSNPNISTSASILFFNPFVGTIDAGRLSQQIEMTTAGAGLTDGVYETAAVITSNAPAPDDSIEIAVTVKVDYTPPLQVQSVAFTSSTEEEIVLDWDANAVSDSVYHYNVYRRRHDEPVYVLAGTSLAPQYTDTTFVAEDTLYIYYKIAAVDWVENEGAQSDSARTWLGEFAVPQNITFEFINDYQDGLVQWGEVVRPGTPTCYVVYHSYFADSEFIFLDISDSTAYVHENVGLFQEHDRMFYRVTAFGGSLRALRYFRENDITFSYGELERMVAEFTEKQVRRP